MDGVTYYVDYNNARLKFGRENEKQQEQERHHIVTYFIFGGVGSIMFFLLLSDLPPSLLYLLFYTLELPIHRSNRLSTQRHSCTLPRWIIIPIITSWNQRIYHAEEAEEMKLNRYNEVFIQHFSTIPNEGRPQLPSRWLRNVPPSVSCAVPSLAVVVHYATTGVPHRFLTPDPMSDAATTMDVLPYLTFPRISGHEWQAIYYVNKYCATNGNE